MKSLAPPRVKHTRIETATSPGNSIAVSFDPIQVLVLPRGTFSCMVLQRDILVSRVLVAFSETVQEHGSMGIPAK
ncbi:hypothetical protein Bca4012_007165 [Brassica carinata]